MLAVKMRPAVLVVILNWNGREWLEGCINSVVQLDYPRFDVLVVDNGSVDGSVELVRRRFPEVQVLETGANLGYSGGFNAGMSHSLARSADYYLLLNNDTTIAPDALTALVDAAVANPHAGFLSGKVYFESEPDVLQTVGKMEHRYLWNGPHVGYGETDVGQYDEIAERPFLDAVYLLVPRGLYEDVGPLNPDLFLQGEEFDWQLRAKNRGWKCLYVPGAKVWHYGSRSMGGVGSPVSEYFVVRSRLVVMALHGGVRRFVRLWAWTGYWRTRSLLGSLRPRVPGRRSRVAGWLGWLAGTLWLVHRRPATGPPWVIRALAAK